MILINKLTSFNYALIEAYRLIGLFIYDIIH